MEEMKEDDPLEKDMLDDIEEAFQKLLKYFDEELKSSPDSELLIKLQIKKLGAIFTIDGEEPSDGEIGRNIDKWRNHYFRNYILKGELRVLPRPVKIKGTYIFQPTNTKIEDAEFSMPTRGRDKVVNTEAMYKFYKSLQLPIVNKEVSLLDLFKDKSRYDSLMNLLVENNVCEPGTFIYKDRKKGYLSNLVSLIKNLHLKDYIINPTNDQCVSIAKKTFGIDVGIDTVKRAKAEDYYFSFLK